jgi:outer membrane protein OmpA-like peptidoglycan-associated protein/tetratricopeptide (TPR) repeat protein
MKKKYIIVLLCFCFSIQLSAQTNPKTSSEGSKADKEYASYAYIDAIKTYERMFTRGYKAPDMLLKLANSYYFNGDFEQSAKWYKELFAMQADAAPECYYRFSQSLKSIKEYPQADEMMAKFNKENGNDLRALLAESQKDYLAVIKKNSGRYTIENIGINSKYSDYGSAYYQNKIVFTSARDTGNFVKRIDSWTGEGFSNLYESNVQPDGTFSVVSKLSGNLNTKFHESTPVFTKDGNTVYFTRNNYNNGKIGKDSNKTILLKIYKADLKEGSWENITELPFNSDNYSVAHPALSSDEKTLYFVSDMPGTIGRSDIFKVSIKENGTYGTPVNLGKTINTGGKETFPFITAENELYFASDGHPGLGGMDVFVSKQRQDSIFKEVINVGDPLNSPQDDFGLLIDSKTKMGYVTSNRAGGIGGDDIYKIKEVKPIESCEQSLSGSVTDIETQQAIIDVKVSLYNSSYELKATVFTDSEGKFDFGEVDCNGTYYIRVEKKEYTTKEQSVTIAEVSGKTILNITVEKGQCKVAIGDDLGKCFGIKMIYFDLDKSNIREEAALDLAKILDFLDQYPKMKIEIRSYTDSRAAAEYNMKLSERRAESTKQWLIKNGIDESRLKAKGFGESQLVNQCADGVDCTEEEHQANRRSEFVLFSM